MKISSGTLRGMGIIMPKNQITRPTLSKLRQAIFNILGNDLSGMVFWDLFSGSGAIGLSALSLGAQEGVFVEEESAAVEALRKNIDEAKKRFQVYGETPPMTLIASDLNKGWSRLRSLTVPDIVWADPPYAESLKWAKSLKTDLASFMKKDALLVMEIQSDHLISAEKEGFLVDAQWELVKTRKYGHCSLVIWKKHQ
jgi:16S rRNA (guanine966-N2)-methyltransferase